MSEKAGVILRLIIGFVVLSSATYYGVSASQTRSELRRLDYLSRQILNSIADGTALHERALSEADRQGLRVVYEKFSSGYKRLEQTKESDWRLTYCFKSGLLVMLRFSEPQARPGLSWSTDSPACE